MIFVNPWLIIAMVAVNLIMTLLLIIKVRKQERFQTDEAHANLELINQSLNRLSEIADKLERNRKDEISSEYVSRTPSEESSNKSKEKQALIMIRRGEKPISISRKLGISRSEIDLLVASEKLGNNSITNRSGAYN